ncbi:MAG: hypothetical protein HKM95_06455 [Inquilinus sp.]|nr:hypothetical protein [Inquilinus sp.]
MDAILGNSVAVFIGLTVVLFGAAAFLTGQALANGWQPASRALPYGLLLACGNRFLAYALFDGELLSLTAFVIDAAVIIAITLLAHRMVQVRKMVSQYPWLYEVAGLFAWRERRDS